MSNVICLMGLFLASIFGIVMYGLMGVDPAGGTDWVEYFVFAIIVVDTLPAAKEFVQMYIRTFRK